MPKPSDATVSVRELPADRFAVPRFSGGRSVPHAAAALGCLREGLTELSPLVYGYFGPKWTPGFLRRNEVMLRTQRAK